MEKKVKSSLQYKPGFPATGNKPSPYDLKTLQKAINRDSTKVADRGMIGDFFDPGVTSGSTGPSDQYNLQINREFRDKQTGSSSEQTAKKINTMKNKKQKGGYMEPSKEVKFGGPKKKMQKGGLTQGKGKVSTSGKSRKRNPNERTPVDPRPSDEMTFLPPGTRGKKAKKVANTVRSLIGWERKCKHLRTSK